MRAMGTVAGLVALVALGCSGGGSPETEPTATVRDQSPAATPTVTVATPTAIGSATATGSTAPPTAAATATSTTPAGPSPPPPASATPTSPPAPTAPPAPSQVLITVRAFDLAFDKQTIHVPANATVTAVLQNDDEGVEHNLSFSLPGLGHGDTCRGPCNRTQTFTAPASGTFFFLCTLHDMSGTVVVDT